MCFILPLFPFSSGATACRFILPWYWFDPGSTWLQGTWCLSGSGSHLHVFGSYSWEPLISHWPVNRSGLRRDLVQSYLSGSLASPDLLPSQQGCRSLQIVKVLRFGVKFADLIGMLLVEIYECTCLLLTPLNVAFPTFSQKHPSKNPKTKTESVFSFDFKKGS